MENAIKFWAKMNADDQFLEALQASDADRAKLIKMAGFDFTVDELAELLRRRAVFGECPLQALAAQKEEKQPKTTGGKA